MMDTGHTRISPSGLGQIILCPGSLRMVEEHAPPVRRSTLAAEVGTRRHEVMASLPSDLATAPYDLQMEVLRDVCATTGLADDAMPVIQAWLRVAAILERHPAKRPGLRMETRTVVDATRGIAGTVDVYWRDPAGALHVLDYKFGRTPVSARGNAQLRAYAYGLAKQCKLAKLCNVYMHIVQPAVSATTSEADDHECATVAGLAQWWADVAAPAVDLALSDDYAAHCRASSEACRWCAATSVCAEHARWRNALAAEVFASHQACASATITPTELVDAYAKLAPLKRAIAALEEAMRAHLETHGPTGGYSLSPESVRRTWRDPDDVQLWDALKAAHVVDYMATTLKSPASLFKIYPELAENANVIKHIVQDGKPRIIEDKKNKK